MKVIVQMDPLESLNLEMDSTLILIKEALNRNFEVWTYTLDKLCVESGDVYATAARIEFEEGKFVNLPDASRQYLRDFDVILMRQDPPVNMDYITGTYMLEPFAGKVFNDPEGVRDLPEKLYASLRLSEFMPATLLTKDIDVAYEFLRKHKEVVIKPLYAFGGRDVFKINDYDALQKRFDEMLSQYKTHVILQQFIPEVKKGDTRIFLINGEITYAINRVPQEDKILANLASGGTAYVHTPNAREIEICKAVGVHLKEMNLIMAGVDIIGGYLTEINVTCITGLGAVNRLYDLKGDKRFESQIWDAMLERLDSK